MGTGVLEKEVEVRGASPPQRSMEEAGLEIVICKRDRAHYRKHWAESDAACSPEQGALVSCFPSYKRRTRQGEVEK